MLSEETHRPRESGSEDPLWVLASRRVYESRISSFLRRRREMPSEVTRLVLERQIAGLVADARANHKPLEECPGLICLCREATLLAVVAADECKRESCRVELAKKLCDGWRKDLDTYLQGLS